MRAKNDNSSKRRFSLKKKLAISKLTLFYYLLTVCMRCPFRYKHMYVYHGILVHNSCLQNRKKIKSIIFDIEV